MQSLNCAFLLRDATSSPTKHTRNIGSVRFEHLDNVCVCLTAKLIFGGGYQIFCSLKPEPWM